MSWVECVPSVLGLVALLYLPGLGFGLLAGVRGLVLVGAAPAVSASVLGVTGIVADKVGLGWGLGTYALGSATLLGVGAALGWWRRRTGATWRETLGAPLSRSQTGGLVLAWAVAATLTVTALRSGMGSPAALLQSWDSVFHLNGVQAVRELGNASSIGGLNSLSGSRAPVVYYPSVWHALVALAPGAVPVAANASTLVMAALVWPLGLAALARAACPRLPLVSLAAPVVGASFLAFPTVLLTTSGQWPNSLSVAVLPGALALATLVLRSWHDSRLGGLLVVLPALAGVVLVHASGAFALVVFLVPLVLARGAAGALALWRAGHRWWVVGGGAAAAGAVVLVVQVLSGSTVLRNTLAYRRAATGTVGDGLRDGMLDVPALSTVEPSTAVLVLVLLGCLAAVVRREAGWLVVAWAVTVGLVGLATGPENDLRWLTGFWYKSAPRVAALVPVAASVLGALGAVWVGHLAQRGARWVLVRRSVGGRHESAWRSPVLPGVLAVSVPVALLGVAWGATDGFRHDDRVFRTAQAYDPGLIRYGAMVDADEVRLLESLGDLLPDDAVLLGDPFNGAAFAYAVSDVEVVFPQLGAAFADPDQQYFELHFRDIHTDPQVCEYVRERGVTHFYADEPGWVEGTDLAARWPGLYGVDVSEGFELVARGGSAAVYRITACDLS